jgi:hypothetical protein
MEIERPQRAHRRTAPRSSTDVDAVPDCLGIRGHRGVRVPTRAPSSPGRASPWSRNRTRRRDSSPPSRCPRPPTSRRSEPTAMPRVYCPALSRSTSARGGKRPRCRTGARCRCRPPAISCVRTGSRAPCLSRRRPMLAVSGRTGSFAIRRKPRGISTDRSQHRRRSRWLVRSPRSPSSPDARGLGGRPGSLGLRCRGPGTAAAPGIGVIAREDDRQPPRDAPAGRRGPSDIHRSPRPTTSPYLRSCSATPGGSRGSCRSGRPSSPWPGWSSGRCWCC